jgi:TPP-dependent pyruvate/acetoin dehydrogenase alpha subunit
VFEAAKKCRSANPGFLEIETYRYREHVGPNYDWDLGYRTEAEVVERIARDPLSSVREKIDGSRATEIEADVQRQVAAAFDAADAAPWPEAVLR